MEISKSLLQALTNAKHIAILTGAGVSAESGIKTFRDPDGLWAKFNPQELASIDGFMANPKLVAEWYQMRKDDVGNAKPNPGHEAIVALEKMFDDVTLITQNVDRLHQRAGSSDVVELHGNIVDNKCLSCNAPFEGEAILPNGQLARCPICGGMIRPNVVWFGEMLPEDALIRAEAAAKKCDVFFAIGTTAEVFPAGNLPLIAKQHGAYLIEVNPRSTVLTKYCDAVLPKPSGEAMPELILKLREMM